jgi:prepilin-type processing-associated H-X9-DG protein
MQYSQDSDGMLPAVDCPARRATWKTDLMPYTKAKAVFLCPARKDDTAGPDGFPISYAVNTAGVGRATGNRGPFAPSSRPVDNDHVTGASQVIAFCEVQKTASPGFDIDDPFFGPRRQVLFAGHRRKSNFLFLDGHARTLPPAQTIAGTAEDGSPTLNLWYLDGAKPLSANGQQILSATDRAFADSTE